MLNFIPINLQVHKIFKITQVLFFRGFSVLWSPKEHINILFTKDTVISVYIKEDKSVHHEPTIIGKNDDFHVDVDKSEIVTQ